MSNEAPEDREPREVSWGVFAGAGLRVGTVWAVTPPEALLKASRQWPGHTYLRVSPDGLDACRRDVAIVVSPASEDDAP